MMPSNAFSQCTDPGLEPAATQALSEFVASTSQDGVRICTINSLSRYWADEDMFTADRSEPRHIPSFLSADELAECHRAEAMICRRGTPESHSANALPEALSKVAHDKSYPDGHV